MWPWISAVTFVLEKDRQVVGIADISDNHRDRDHAIVDDLNVFRSVECTVPQLPVASSEILGVRIGKFSGAADKENWFVLASGSRLCISKILRPLDATICIIYLVLGVGVLCRGKG